MFSERAAAAGIAAITVSLLAAWGGGTKPATQPTTQAPPLTRAQYASEVLPLIQKVEAISHGLPDPHSFGTASETLDFTSLAGDIDGMAKELASIQPPAAVRLLHQDLVRDARTIQNGLTRVAAASQAKDVSAADGPLGEISAALGDMRATFNAIEAKLSSGR